MARARGGWLVEELKEDREEDTCTEGPQDSRRADSTQRTIAIGGSNSSRQRLLLVLLLLLAGLLLLVVRLLLLLLLGLVLLLLLLTEAGQTVETDPRECGS